MKKIIVTFMTIVAFATITTITSCTAEVDKCKDVTCGTYGTCVEGTCTCDAGYEGTNCETEVRTKFINEPNGWSVTEDGTSSAATTYTTHIQTSTTAANTVRILNVWNTFTNAVIATVSGTTLTIARQQPDNDSFYVEGTGTINGNTLTLTYKVTDETGGIVLSTDAFGLGSGTASAWTKL